MSEDPKFLQWQLQLEPEEWIEITPTLDPVLEQPVMLIECFGPTEHTDRTWLLALANDGTMTVKRFD